MTEFVCRLCGASEDIGNPQDGSGVIYNCVSCGVLFVNPISFSLPPVKFIKLHKDAVTPTKAKEGDVGFDVVAIENVKLWCGNNVMVQTGIAVELPPNTEIQVRARSGLAKKYGIMVTNSPGTIDTGYRGPCNVILYNAGQEHYQIKKGDKIAQFVVSPKMPYKFIEASELGDSERGDGGFGHTGK